MLSTIGATIRQARTDRDLSQEDLATVIGIDRAHLSRIEAGKHNISVRTLGQVAHALGLSLDALCARVTLEVLTADQASNVSERRLPAALRKAASTS